MTTFIIAALGIGGAAMAARAGLRSIQRMRGIGSIAGKKFFEGGFESEMSRKEAAMILGIKEGTNEEEIKAAHRKLMRLNHPDNGGSTYVSTKINEAKETMLGGRKR
jgi:DnaJ family protein C protein 19